MVLVEGIKYRFGRTSPSPTIGEDQDPKIVDFEGRGEVDSSGFFDGHRDR